MITSSNCSRTWLVAMTFVLCSPAGAAPPSVIQQSEEVVDLTGSPSHVINEGGSEQPLWIDSSRVADFGQEADRPVLRPSGSVTDAPSGKSDGNATSPSNTQVSPLFYDASGQTRALPGGVIVGLKAALPEQQARLRLEAAGLVPLRSLGARMWLVDSPAGIDSLHLADRLQRSGDFEFVEPNWWRPRRTK